MTPVRHERALYRIATPALYSLWVRTQGVRPRLLVENTDQEGDEHGVEWNQFDVVLIFGDTLLCGGDKNIRFMTVVYTYLAQDAIFDRHVILNTQHQPLAL
jgi:hypothetical protein